MKIGEQIFSKGLFLGPMAGVSDASFRLLCREQGCDQAYTEMISAKGIYYENRKTEQLLTVYPEEGQVAVQLFGSQPQLMAEMAARIDNEKIAFFDINVGCPVPKVVNNGEGSALMERPERVAELVEAMVNQVTKPVTIKIRKGFTKERPNAVEVAEMAEQAGAAAITVHGRTRDQYYAGQADWSIIRQVKQAVKIPVIGSGDVIDGPTAKQMFEQTGCDGVMIARAARGNPWLFREVKGYLATGRLQPSPTGEEKRAMILRHANLLIEHKGEYIGLREMRKHLAWYTRGMKKASRFRGRLSTIECLDELKGIIDELFD